MQLKEILAHKGAAVQSIRPDANLDDVVAELVRHNIGSLVVRDAAGEMRGIVTERDILRAQNSHRAPLDRILVETVMSTDMITANPEDRLEVAMRLMTNHRVRHLPVVADGTLQGIVSIGDIVKAHHDELELENHFMRSYIQGDPTPADASALPEQA